MRSTEPLKTHRDMNKTLLLTLLLICLAGCTVPVEVVTSKSDGSLVTNVVYQVDPRLTKSVQTAKGLNTHFNPTPTAPIVNLLLSLTTIGAGIFAQRKNKKAVDAIEVLGTVVKAVDSSDVKPKVKEAVKSASEIAGNAVKVKRLVQDALGK